MKFASAVCIVGALVAIAQPAVAQQTLDYRVYVLGSTVETVLALSGASVQDVKTQHDQPALIQQLEWSPPYASSARGLADPVRHVVFSFCDGALYQVLVSYDSRRTEGLSNSDVIATLAEAYGMPLRNAARNRPLEAAADTIVIAQWDTPGSSLTLLRLVYQPDFQLLLTSKALATRARGAIRAAEQREMKAAPRREQEQREQEAQTAEAALEKTRATNKAAFRP